MVCRERAMHAKRHSLQSPKKRHQGDHVHLQHLSACQPFAAMLDMQHNLPQQMPVQST